MEIAVKEFRDTELIAVKGRVDSVEASRFAKALEDASHRGKYKLVIDMSQLEYMSSAGFRALAAAQRNSKRRSGEVVLAHVPDQVREALEIVGFTEYFRVFDNVTSALEYTEDLPAGTFTADAHPSEDS